MRAIRLALAAARDPAGACTRELVGGVDALVSRPRSDDAPVVVFANAATPAGIDQPAVARLLHGLAAAGFVGVAPELPRVRDGIVTPATVEALVRAARAAAPRVTLLGASTGAALAILAAADRSLAPRVDAVGAVAPFGSLRKMLRLGTTGFYAGEPFAAAPLVAEALSRSLRCSAPDDPGVEHLFANRDPARFAGLYAALEPRTRALFEELSPINAIAHVRAPVELLVGAQDAYCPTDESRALAHAGRSVRLTVTTGLEHVCPRMRPGAVDVLRFLERTLAFGVAAEPSTFMRPALA
jgi:pimeloyl-ACP methyl ester carboxylesterase